MSNWQSRHPEEGVLLLHLDGELPARRSRQVRKHLEACWQCRAELEALEATVAECIRYRKAVLATHLPEPPNPWADLIRGFDRIDAAQSAEPLWKRLWTVPRPLAWSTAVLALVAMVAGIYYQLELTPSVQAAGLLKKAVIAEQVRPLVPRRVRIRTKSDLIVRTVGMSRAVEAAMPESVTSLLQEARYDAADPLSARSFEIWRDGVASKRDEVDAAADYTQIRTIAATGEVASASLKLRSNDLRPVEGKLEFRDQNFVEFTDITESLPTDGSPVAMPLGTPARPAVPSRPAAIAPGKTASISDELQVLSALHEIGADLGDPIDVKLQSGRVLVSGAGVAPERRRQIHGLLDTLPHVEVAFSDPTPVPSPSQATVVDPGTGAGVASPLETRLEQQLGGRPELERFSSQVLQWNEEAMSRAYALRVLAQRFPASAEAGMDAADRRELRRIALEHVATLANHIRGIESALRPALTGLGARDPGSFTASPAPSWQANVDNLLSSARRVDVLLSVLLGVAPAEKAGTTVPSDLLRAMDELNARIASCQGLLAQ